MKLIFTIQGQQFMLIAIAKQIQDTYAYIQKKKNSAKNVSITEARTQPLSCCRGLCKSIVAVSLHFNLEISCSLLAHVQCPMHSLALCLFLSLPHPLAPLCVSLALLINWLLLFVCVRILISCLPVVRLPKPQAQTQAQVFAAQLCI